MSIFPDVNALSLLRTLATGFVPLLAYILADLVFGETIGLFVGLGIGILDFAISFAREKRADLFIAADTLLLAAMGALSLALRNQLFFRLKPAVMEGIVAVSMAILLFLPQEALKAYMGHQVRGLELGEESLPALRRSLGLMVSVLFLHAALTAWAALAASTAVWGFVSGGSHTPRGGWGLRVAGARRWSPPPGGGGPRPPRGPLRRVVRRSVRGRAPPGPPRRRRAPGAPRVEPPPLRRERPPLRGARSRPVPLALGQPPARPGLCRSP